MAVAITLLVAVLAILFQQTHNPQADVATAQRMQQREEFLHQELSRLWQEVEQEALEKAFLHSVFYWLCQAAAAFVLIEVSLQKQLGSSSCPEQDSYSSEEEEEDSEEDEDLNGSHTDDRSLAWADLFPTQELPELSRNLKQLLLDVRELFQGSLMPKISPRPGMKGTRESWRVLKN